MKASTAARSSGLSPCTCAPASNSAACAADSRFNALCKSITSRCRLSPPLSEIRVSLAMCASSSVSAACCEAAPFNAARRASALPPSAASPALIGRIMVATSSQIAASRFASPGAASRSPAMRLAPLTSVSNDTGSRRAAIHSFARSKRAPCGSRARPTAACKTLSRAFTRSLAAKPSPINAGNRISVCPSCSMICDFMVWHASEHAFTKAYGCGIGIEPDQSPDCHKSRLAREPCGPRIGQVPHSLTRSTIP